MRNSVIAILVSILSVGCGSISNRFDTGKILLDKIPAGSGVAIISTGAPERCMSMASFLKVLPASSGYDGSALALLPIDAYVSESDFADHQGNIDALTLPAGDYYLATWTANPYVRAAHVPKAEFSIAAGEVVYLGEYFKPSACHLTGSNVLRDRRARDLKFISERNPQLGSATIVTRIPQFSGNAITK